jgi:hypothetical protein
MRTRWILRPCAFKSGDQVWLRIGTVEDTERVHSRTAAQGRVSGGVIWHGWPIADERYGLVTPVRNRRKPILRAAPAKIPTRANQHFDSVQNCSDT